MPIHRLAFALCATLVLAGCMTQRDSAEMETAGDGTAERDTTEADTTTTRGGMPNVPVYIYGTWDFAAKQVGGGDTITGVLTIAEEQGASRLVTSDGIDAPLAVEEMDVTNANFVLSGTVQGAEPMPVRLAGSLSGDEMTAEAYVGARGTYALTAVRRPN